MKLALTADLHGMHQQVTIPKADVLVVAGDVTGHGEWYEVENFIEWVKQQPVDQCVFIAGNHDRCLSNPNVLRDSPYKEELAEDYSIHYLQDSSIVINGIHFYGSPWTPQFMNWSFMYERESEEAELIWNEIPSDVDILITHGPPKYVLDRSFYNIMGYTQDCGCEVLADKIRELEPPVHCYGHIHECYGQAMMPPISTQFINASACTLDYRPTNKPVLIEV